MRSTNLAFDFDYLMDRDDHMFNVLTSDYEFRCNNYSVAYNLIQFLNDLKMCEHSGILDDCFYPYDWVIFITCRPQDIERMMYVAKHLPSSIKANIRLLDESGETVLWT